MTHPQPTARIVTLEDLRARFGLRSPRAAGALMRKMRHVREGSRVWTTEEWLAEWLAQKSVVKIECQKTVYDPLEDCVVARVVHLVGELAKRGQISVKAI